MCPQVCAACHSVYQLHFRDLVGVAYTEDEAKAMAAEIETMDGPNDEGEPYERPGRLSDPLPRCASIASHQSCALRYSRAVTALLVVSATGYCDLRTVNAPVVRLPFGRREWRGWPSHGADRFSSSQIW